MYTYETYKAIQEFHQAVLEKNNKRIEECIVVKLLDKVLTSQDDELIATLTKETVLYRARVIDTPKAYDDTECGINAWFDDNYNFHCNGYNYYESKEPPLSVSGIGRNNLLGVSYLYLAEDRYTACAEIKPPNRGMISVAKFKIEKDLKIVNFCDKVESYEHIDFINEYKVYPHQIMIDIFSSFTRLCRDEKTYILTQFLSDYVRKAGFDGIKYWGAANYGVNYTIFNSHKSNVSFVDSKIIAVASVEYNLVDLENEINIQPTKKQTELNVELTQRLLVRNLKQVREKNNG